MLCRLGALPIGVLPLGPYPLAQAKLDALEAKQRADEDQMQRQRAQSVSLDAERRKMLRHVGGG